jgi:hypothetical protein
MKASNNVWFACGILAAIGGLASAQSPSAPTSGIGREVSVPLHLKDGEELTLPLPKLLAQRLLLFQAN